VREDDRENQIRMFTEEEIKHAIFDMKRDVAPGPNGFGAVFL
jgi:hypothetical protein